MEEKKREMRKELRRLRKDKISREECIRKRGEYKKWCKGEKKKHEKEEEEKIKTIKTEKEAWKYINKYKKKREKITENIGIESWKRHFMEIPKGAEERTIMEEEKGIEEEGGLEKSGEEEEITKEEVVKQLRRLKNAKAPGKNGIENEAWRWMPKETGEVLLQLLNKMCKEG